MELSAVSVILMVCGLASWAYAVAALLILVENRRFARRHRDQLIPFPDPHARIALVITCRGMEHQLRENLIAYLHQDFSDMEVIFAVESESDPAVSIIRNLIDENRFIKSRIVVSGPAERASQKITQLQAACRELSDDVNVIVFAQSDQRPRNSWLRWMVGRLSESPDVVITAVPWAIPRYQTLPTKLYCAILNRFASLFGPGGHLPIWGGAWAIRREHFVKAGLSSAWNQVACDDLVATRAIRSCGLTIRYEPQCMSGTLEQVDWRQFFVRTTQKLMLMRVYHRPLWLAMTVALIATQVGFWGGWCAIGWYAPERAKTAATIAAGMALIYGLGAMRGLVRNQIGKINVPNWREYRRTRRLDVIAWPLIGTLLLGLLAASLLRRRLVSRGWDYSVQSNGLIRVLGRVPDPALVPRVVSRPDWEGEGAAADLERRPQPPSTRAA